MPLPSYALSRKAPSLSDPYILLTRRRSAKSLCRPWGSRSKVSVRCLDAFKRGDKTHDDVEAAIPFSLEGRSLDVSDFVKHAIQEAFTSARAKKAPSLDVDRCLLMVSPSRFLSMLWAELMVVSAMGQLNICRRIATYVLSTPRSSRSPPLLPIFLHLILPNIMESADHLLAAEQATAVELLAVVISSALTSALYVEWALQSVCKEKRLVLGQTALAMARRLSGDLRRKGHSPVSGGVVQRLVSNTQFVSNFPTFTGDM